MGSWRPRAANGTTYGQIDANIADAPEANAASDDLSCATSFHKNVQRERF